MLVKKVGFIIDSLDSLNIKKDSTLSMVQAAFDRGAEVYLLEADKINVNSGIAKSKENDERSRSNYDSSAEISLNASTDIIKTNQDIYKKDSLLNDLSDNLSDIFCEHGYKVIDIKQNLRFILKNKLNNNSDKKYGVDDVLKLEVIDNVNCAGFDYIFMRKDPPFDSNYIYLTYFLEYLQDKYAVKIINNPRSLRDVNEKIFIFRFSEFISPTLVSQSVAKILDFCVEHERVVLKPLNAMGGMGIIDLDVNKHTEVERESRVAGMIKNLDGQMIMAQKFLDVNRLGDKRVLLINGKPVPYALARFPAKGSFVANLAAGGEGKVVPLTKRDLEICSKIGPVISQKGLYLVGLDIVDDCLTEVNVTSPTCIREINTAHDLDISGELMELFL